MNTLEKPHEDFDPLDREYAPGWTEEPGDKIRGTLVSRDERDAGFGTYPIYTLALTGAEGVRTKTGELMTGEVAVHAQRDVLRRKLANAGLSLGDVVAIKYQGPPRGAARSHRYRVIKFLPDGSFVEASYESRDEPDNLEDAAPDDDDAATAAGLEAERDERDAAVSAAEGKDE